MPRILKQKSCLLAFDRHTIYELLDAKHLATKQQSLEKVGFATGEGSKPNRWLFAIRIDAPHL